MAGIEVLLAALLLGFGGLGLWQLNRPLSAEGNLIVSDVPEGSVLLDARGPLAYRSGHLPGALRLWSRDLLAFEGEVPGMLASPEALAETLAALGLDTTRPVVVYDAGTGEDAPMVTLVLRAMGLDAYLLRGGLELWRSNGGSVTTELPPAPEPSSAVLTFDSRLLVDAEGTRRHLEENAVAPLDTRAAPLYMSGHLDGAINLEASQLLPAGTFPRWSELDRLLAPARLTRDTHPIIYGESVAEAAQAWLALAAYGVTHIHVYSGPFEGLVTAGLPITQVVAQAATSTRTSSVCWQ